LPLLASLCLGCVCATISHTFHHWGTDSLPLREMGTQQSHDSAKESAACQASLGNSNSSCYKLGYVG
jgi:hypothetical protein